MEGSGGIGSRTQVLAHRGYHFNGPSENSLGAFDAGVRLGVDQLELDVRKTRDGVMVIHHDPDLPDGRKLADVDFADLPPLPDGQRIPTLDAVADFAALRGAHLAIEFKEEGYEQEALDHILARLPREQFDIISFSRKSIGAVEQFDPQIRTGLLEPRLPEWLRSSPFYGASLWFMNTFHWHPSLSAAAKVGADFVSAEDRMVTDGFVQDAHERGIGVMAWTVDDPVRMRELMGFGVDGIVTNRPDLALEARGPVDASKGAASLLAA
jgi:glycerophosphoryl diester phosphodiesterase